MIIKLSIILLFAVFIVLMAYWVVRTEERPRKEPDFVDPKKSYQMAKELGLRFPSEYDDALPGV